MSGYSLKHPIIITTRAADGNALHDIVMGAGETVTLKRPKARDLKIMDRFGGREIEGAIHMIAALSGLEQLWVENMDAEDFSAMGEQLAAFMPDGPTTGAIA